jgi:hypothetical protein
VAAFQASNSVRDIGRNLALSSKEAKNFRNELALTSAGSEDILVTTQGLIEANQTLNEVRGTGVKFTKEQLLDTNRLLKGTTISATPPSPMVAKVPPGDGSTIPPSANCTLLAFCTVANKAPVTPLASNNPRP